MVDVPDLTFLRQQNAELLGQLEERSRDGAGGGGPPRMTEMNIERLGRVEGEISGLKHGQNMTLGGLGVIVARSEEHTSELQSHLNLVCRLLLEKKKKNNNNDRS